MQLPKKLAITIVIVVGLAFTSLIALSAFIPSTIRLTFHDKSRAAVQSPSLIKSLLTKTSCAISYQPITGKACYITLRQDAYDEPALILPSSRKGDLLCLYDNDIDLRVYKFNPSVDFKSYPSNSTLYTVVLYSSCDVTDAAIEDWREVLEHLKSFHTNELKHELLPSYVFLGFRVPESREYLIRHLESQIRAMESAGTNKWPLN